MTLTADSRRLVHALAKGGVGVRVAKGWRIHRGSDLRRRAAGRLSVEAVDDLVARRVLAIEPGPPARLVGLRDAGPVEPPSALDGWRPGAGGRDRKERRSLLEKALAQAGEDSGRLAAAARRFAADVERAATPGGLTMRWDGAPRSGAWDGRSEGPGIASAAAQRRLQALVDVLEPGDPTALRDAIIDGVAAAAWARRRGLPSAREAPRRLLEALTRLADAYDQKLPRAG